MCQFSNIIISMLQAVINVSYLTEFWVFFLLPFNVNFLEKNLSTGINDTAEVSVLGNLWKTKLFLNEDKHAEVSGKMLWQGPFKNHNISRKRLGKIDSINLSVCSFPGPEDTTSVGSKPLRL